MDFLKSLVSRQSFFEESDHGFYAVESASVLLDGSKHDADVANQKWSDKLSDMRFLCSR